MPQYMGFDFEGLNGANTSFDGLERGSREKLRIFPHQHVTAHSIILSPIAQQSHDMPSHACYLVALFLITKDSFVDCRSERGIDPEYSFNLICQAVNTIDGELRLSEHLQNRCQLSARFIRGRIISFRNQRNRNEGHEPFEPLLFVWVGTCAPCPMHQSSA